MGAWLVALVAVAGVAVVVVRLRQSGFDWQRFVSVFRRMNLWWMGASLALVLVTYLGRALRWGVMIRPIRPHPNLWNLFSATAVGFTAIVIFGRAGEMVRPYLISVKEEVSFTSQVAAWLLERIYDLLAVLLVFGFAISQLHHSDVKVGPALGWALQFGGRVVGVSCFLCLAALVVLRQFSDKARKRLMGAIRFLPPRLHEKVERVLEAFVQGMESTRSHTFTALLVFYTLVEWAVISACYVCLFKAFPETAQLSVADVLIFLGFVAFGSMIQIPGIGGGMQIVSVLVLTELFGCSVEVSTGLAVVVWTTTFIVIVPLGLALGLSDGLSWRKIRQLRSEAHL